MITTEKPPTDTKQATPQTNEALPRVVGGAVLVLIGGLWLLERTGVIEISVTAVLALATMVTGIAVMVLSRTGPHVGLIVLGSLLALVTLLTAAAPFEGFQGGVGDRTVEISSVNDIRVDYNLAMGKLTIDMREVDDLRTDSNLKASVGMGELIVLVPEGTAVSVNARIGAGQAEILGRSTDGLGVSETYQSPGFDDAGRRLTLDLRAFAGRVEVKYG